MNNFDESLGTSDYNSRALVHARRLLSLHLLSQTSHYEFFGINVEGSIENGLNPVKESSITVDDEHIGSNIEKEMFSFKSSSRMNEFFHVNPIDYRGKTFVNDREVYIKDVGVSISVVIDSYDKAIKLLTSHKEKDLAVQAMHELGNIYHFNRDLTKAYRYWNEALDTLMGVKNCVIQWRKEFYNEETKVSDTEKILEKCGIWGCLLGGVLTSKMAQ